MTHELDKIYLYSQFPLTINKNTTINGLFNDTLFLDYLNNYENRYEINNFPRIEIGMQISLTININDMNKLNGEVLLDRIDGINYLRVEKTQQWGDEEEPRKTNYYYFIDNSYFSSDSTITLECTLDTVQSFYFRFIDSVSDKSFIERTHQNRFGYDRLPIFDKVLENIDIEKTYTIENPSFTLNSNDANKNYLAYKMMGEQLVGEYYSDNSPIASIRFVESTSLVFLTAVHHETLNIFYDVFAYEGTLVVELENGTKEIVFRSGSRDYIMINGQANGALIRVELREKTTGAVIREKRFEIAQAQNLYYQAKFYLTFENMEADKVFLYNFTGSPTSLTNDEAIFDNIQNNIGLTWNFIPTDAFNNVVPVVTPPTSALDLSQSNLVKVLDIPYINTTNTISLRTSENLYQHIVFESIKITRTSGNYLRAEDNLSNYATNANKLDGRWFYIDPKMYNSQFTNYYFIYDDAKIEYKMENMEHGGAVKTAIFDIYYSDNLGSNFLVELKIDGNENETLQDNFMSITRDNSVPLLNSEYLNYIRNGYEYDMRNLKTEQGKQMATFVINLIGSIASFTMSGVTGGFSAATGVGMATNAINTGVNMAVSNKQGLAKITQQMKQMMEVAPNVRGTSVDLFRKMGNQRIRNIVIEPSWVDKRRLDDTFFYTGYALGIYDKPNVNSRYRFNYLKGTLDFNLEGESPKIKNEIINDIITRFQNGVTIMHLNEDESFNYEVWFTYENWERHLL